MVHKLRQKKYIIRHNAQVIPKEKVGEVLPWVHIAISNAKRQLINTFWKYVCCNILQLLSLYCLLPIPMKLELTFLALGHYQHY